MVRRCIRTKHVLVAGLAALVLAGCNTYRWSRQLGGQIWTARVEINDVAVTADGTSIAVGRFANTVDLGLGSHTALGGNDSFVVARDKNGNALWDRVFGSSGDDNAAGVAIGADGTIAVVGGFTGTVDFGAGPLTATSADGYAVALNANGSTRWAAKIGGASSDSATEVAIGSAVAVTGTYSGAISIGAQHLANAGGADAYVATLSLATGQPQWAASYGRNGTDLPLGVAVDSANRVTITGRSDSSARVAEVFAAQFRSDGSSAWSKIYGTGQGSSVAIAPGDDVVLTGSFTGSITFGPRPTLGPSKANDIFVVRLDHDGANARWANGYTNPQFSYDDVVSDVAVDNAGDVVLTGAIIGPFDFGGGPTQGLQGRDSFLLKLKGPTGAYAWANRFVSLDGQYIYSSGVATSADNSITVTGIFSGGLQLVDDKDDTKDVVLTARDGNSLRTDSYVAAFGP